MKTAVQVREAVETVLAAVDASPGPVLSEQAFLRELIGVFANTGSIPNVLLTVPGLAKDSVSLERLHQEFRADLQAFVDGRLVTADRKRIYAAADRVLMIPRTGDDGPPLYRYLPESLQAALAHAMRLLLTKDHGTDLKQCQWRECNLIKDARNLAHIRRFFFVSERREAMAAAGKQLTGKLPDRYCSEEHMKAAHRERATEATIRRRRELRERKLKAKAKRR